jgi:hypothetical protein
VDGRLGDPRGGFQRSRSHWLDDGVSPWTVSAYGLCCWPHFRSRCGSPRNGAAFFSQPQRMSPQETVELRRRSCSLALLSFGICRQRTPERHQQRINRVPGDDKKRGRQRIDNAAARWARCHDLMGHPRARARGLPSGGECAQRATEITPTIAELDATHCPGLYSLVLTTAHTNTLGELQLHVTGAAPTPPMSSGR